MKKLLFCILAITGLFSGCMFRHNDLLHKVENRGELIIATEGSWTPWTYHDENGNLTGFDIEVGQALAKKLNVKARFVETKWENIFSGINDGTFDIACNGIEIIPIRLENYDFTVPYGVIRTVIITRKERTDINSFSDLAGKTVAQADGSTYSLIAERQGAFIIEGNTLEKEFQLLEQGEVDAFLNSSDSFYEYMKQHPDKPFKVVAFSKRFSPVAIPLQKGQRTSTLRQVLNTAILELSEEGTLSAISAKYFGSDITQ